MLGRFGFVFVMLAVLVCTGVITGSESFSPDISASASAGAVIMIAAVCFLLAVPALVRRLPEEKRAGMNALLRLMAVVICGIGAIVVFCG